MGLALLLLERGIGKGAHAVRSRSWLWSFLARSPALVVFAANALFVRNHFYARGPYLHDSGWFSYTVFRAGLLPPNPLSCGGDVIPYYFGWHISLLVSLGSLLSYLFPGERVEWYCVIQGAIYAALAFVVPLLVPRDAERGPGALVGTVAASLAVAFGGQVLSCMGYPHFEIFSGAGTAIMLAALAMGRERLAWLGLAMSVATREDGGFHAGVLLLAVIAADVLGRTFPLPRRKVVIMAAMAFTATALPAFLQKRLFYGVDSWEMYLVGKPPFAHLSIAILRERGAAFVDRCGFIWAPMLATAAIAAVRRDARYLLGWDCRGSVGRRTWRIDRARLRRR